MPKVSRPLAGRIALVTGGRGIAAGVARCLARDGADVVVIYRRDAAAAKAVAEEVRGLGRRSIAIQADLRDRDACLSAAAQASEALGIIDILVHCAGTATRGRSAVETSLEEFNDAFAIHALGGALLAQALVPAMRAKERGDVIFITSSIEHGGGPGIAPYHMAKAAAEAFAHSLAHEERAHGIRVNIVRPGFTETDMGRRLTKGLTGSDDTSGLHAGAPFGRLEQPEDLGNVVAFLCSAGAAYITNQVIVVDGGQATIGGALDAVLK
jgi:3-oxoacyl-[acyl-carrier protein] reductase